MVELTRDIQERMNNVAYHFAIRLENNVKSVLNQEKYKSSGALAGSVRIKVKEADGYNSPVINLTVLEHGEYIGKRKLLWTKTPPASELTEWVQKNGYSDGSGNVPGYRNGAPKLSNFQRAERIAWAIAISKRKNDTRFRRQTWKKESFPDVLKAMNQKTMQEFGAHIERLFKESLEKGR